MGAKDQLDQGGKEGSILFNEDIHKCQRRQQFMDKNHEYLTEAITQYKEEGELEEDPNEMLNVLDYIA